ncbi:MAG: tetratricopeptide repeat protein, partial [Candidatus Riflebacteria bacterium]|nr:tetratricopeptide repeat protein [Candidatus Riflebacteria bacterium]
MSAPFRFALAAVLLFRVAAGARADLGPADQALLDGDHARATSLFKERIVRGGAGTDRALVGLGTARKLASDPAGAIQAFDRVIEEHAAGGYRARATFRKAEALGAAGRWEEAAAIMEREAQRLLSPGRKEEMAQGYLELADKAANPPDRSTARDPARAVQALTKALEIGLPPAKARAVRLARARAYVETGQTQEARSDLDLLAKELPSGKGEVAEVDEMRILMAQALSKAGEQAKARRVLRELAARTPPGPRAPQALLELARTYALPDPASDADLERGAEALKELSTRFVQDASALEGQILLARSLINRGRHDEAQAQLRALGERSAATVPADLMARARVMLARSLRAQKRFDQALAAYAAYLSAHPFHEESVAAQREVVDARFEAALDLVDAKKLAEAHKAFETFLAQHPLDDRGAEALVRMADLTRAQENVKGAIEAYRRVVSKYPGTDPSSRAQYEVGQLFELTLKDPRAALVEYSRLDWGSFAAQARERQSALRRRELILSPGRVFRSSEPAQLVVRTRNLKSLSIRAYRVDPATYFARTHSLFGLDTLDIDLIKPDHAFEVPLEGAQEFVPHETKVPLPLKGPGLWVVQAGEEELVASIGVLISDLDVLVKASRGSVFVMTWDPIARKPKPGVAVTLSDGTRTVGPRTTGQDGTLVVEDRALPDPSQVVALALAGGSAATTALSPGAASASGLSPRGYIYTDRPAYRPGQLVHLKGIVRDVRQNVWSFTPGEELPLSVSYPSGRPLWQGTTKLSEFGCVTADVSVPEGAPEGDYQIRIGNVGPRIFTGSF